MGSNHACAATWAPVEKECRRHERLCPELRRSGAVKKHCAHAIVKRPEYAFGLAILL
jgi:hypothetical protein